MPLGYVDRPRSANVLRLLHLAELPVDAISKERLRQDNPYDGLSDAAAVPGPAAGPAHAACSPATSEINENFGSWTIAFASAT